ncbi:uncharacterized protein BXZ73DRAFT_55093 [Epithele typhae]|uniref:uncharacterized protein n=1 Tax=Epithele typhae TaxID=378194 RepID=UPI0020073D20|nr:uncharacterized protein BXZ73DRAFT_55093 [Epithele typhae]KAH9914185.1 hypothetical protein BXZ73DRAFT_55093 [Epithele typhae]
MFGEHESESPRVPSPWDPFLPSPPTVSPSPPFASPALHNGIPKLVPEVEEGNIEYKLKLTNISNGRFARLVTQLKWRLLEGGGQAYYELGVADSGALIGLTRADLEESLGTLEMMAGEIGASVIVVKEIEVPPTVAALADLESGYTDPDTGEWTRKMRRRGAPSGELSTSVTSTSTTTLTDGETDGESSAPEFADLDDLSELSSSLQTPGDGTPALVTPAAIAHRHLRSDPAWPTAQCSPSITPLDDDLALFSMEPEPAFREDAVDAALAGALADDELEVVGAAWGTQRASFAGVEIAAVFKPRPVRQRAREGTALGATAGRHGKRHNKNKEKKVHPWQQQQAPPSSPGEHAEESGESKEEKAALRRLARDRKREERRAALVAMAEHERGGENEAGAGVGADGGLGTGTQGAGVPGGVGEVVVVDVVNAGEGEREGRLIVEALVVRKLSIEEATLDFGRLMVI